MSRRRGSTMVPTGGVSPVSVSVAVCALAVLCQPAAGQVERRTYERFPPEGVEIRRLDSPPLVTIGVAAGEPAYEFSRIAAAAPFRSGVLVVDGTSNELRRFDADGRHVETVGGEGGGPGEFEQLRWMAVTRGDTVLAWDLRNRRLTRFDPDLRLIESTRLATSQLYVMAGAFEDGELLLWPFGLATGGRAGAARVTRDESHFARVRLERPATLDTVVRVPGSPVYSTPDGASARVPFTTTASAAVGGDAIWAGSGTDGSLVRYDRDGTPRVEIRLPPGRPIESGELETYTERSLEDLSGAERSERERLLAELPIPDRLPAFGHLVADEDDGVWVRRYVGPDDEVEIWAIFDRDGTPVGALELPRSFTLMSVRSGLVVCVTRDELDIERVVVYEIPG